MLTFIIYAKDEKFCDIYKKIIGKFMSSKDGRYELRVIDEYCLDIAKEFEEIKGFKIFLLEIGVPTVSGIDIAKKIRYKGDFVSPVILISDKNENLLADELSNVLYLDIIDKNRTKDIMTCLKDAYKIATRCSIFSFSTFDEIYRLPYDDMYFIEKNLNLDSVTIYTKDDTYQNYISIKSVERKLKDDVRFLKVHRSCIVNLFNVVSYDRKTNTLTFKNGVTTNLVARSKRRVLIERLNDLSVG